MLYQTWCVRKSLPIGTYVNNGLPYLVPGFVMFIIARFVGQRMGVRPVTLLFEVFVGATVYLVISAPHLYLRYEKIILIC